jgi:RNA polymerase sigma factor (sigma-70 family)
VSTRFRDGDPEAVRAAYRAYGRVVYAVAYRILGDRGLAEEATLHAFIKAWRAAASLDAERELGPRLVSLARRVAIDVSRREAVRAADPLDSSAARDPGPSASREAAETIYDIWEVRRAVAELPADEQEVVRLQHFEGLTHAEIGQRLGVAIGTVKSRSFRAHKRLAALLGHLRD